MKIAIAGKGGAGKTYVAAGLARLFARDAENAAQEKNVYAVDADPLCGLGRELGLPRDEIERVKPIAVMSEFFHAGDGGALYLTGGQNFNGQNSLLADGGSYSAQAAGVRYLRMAGLKRAGEGGYGREHGFLRALINSLALGDGDVLILDMGSGIEHMTRGTIKGADMLLVISEATAASVDAARTIRSLGAELSIKHIRAVANKITNEQEEVFMRANFPRGELAGIIRMSGAAAGAGIGAGRRPAGHLPRASAYGGAENAGGSDGRGAERAYGSSADMEALYRNIKSI